MGRVEEVTLPARFILTAAHLIATLTIVYDSVRPRDEARTTRAASPSRSARPAMPLERPSVQTARRVNNHHPSPSDANVPLPTQSDTVKRALGSDLGDYKAEKTTLEGLAWTSIVFFGVEFAGMFSGVSLFFHTANVFYIWAHFFGAVFVGLFVCLEWELSSFRWLFTLFSLFPALSEIVIGFLVLQMNILQYK